MKYRVSFYRKAEVVKGRAPRIFEDVIAANEAEALQQLFPKGYVSWDDRHKAQPEDSVVRSVYKAPDKPIPANPSYIFESSSALNRWYRTHKAEAQQKERFCKKGCGRQVPRYQRICEQCRAVHKYCADCGKEIDSRRRYCSHCLSKHENEQELQRRKKRRNRLVLSRLERQLEEAKTTLAVATKETCVNAVKYQGLRFPHITGEPCRACLRKFIEVQTNYYEHVKSSEAPPPPVECPVTLEASV